MMKYCLTLGWLSTSISPRKCCRRLLRRSNLYLQIWDLRSKMNFLFPVLLKV